MIEHYKIRDNYKLIEKYKSVLVVGENTEQDVFISYVIPTCNRIDTLKSAVQSVRQVKHQVPYEIVVVDNSENMSSDSLAKAYFSELNDPHIKYYVNEKNLGMDGNWNRCVELARGQYISYLHDDDLLHENYEFEILRCIHNIAQSKHNIGFICPCHALFYDEGELPPLKQYERGIVRRERKLNSLIEGKGATATPTCGILFNRTALLQTGGFDARLYPSLDHIIGFILQQNGYCGYRCADALGYYRIGVNESMRFKTVLGFCKQDQVIREYMYRDNILFRLFGALFRNIQYADSVEGSYRWANNWLHCQCSLSDLDFLNAYAPHKLGKKILGILKRLCYAWGRFL